MKWKLSALEIVSGLGLGLMVWAADLLDLKVPDFVAWGGFAAGTLFVLIGLLGIAFSVREKRTSEEIREPPSIPKFLSMRNIEASGWLPYRRLIPMTKAARDACRSTMNTIYAAAAENGIDENLTIESWYCTLLVDGGKTPIFGCKYGIGRFAQVPPDVFRKGNFSSDGSSISYFSEKQARYVSLAIRKDDLKRRVKEIIASASEN